jgi:hypothetical protein
VEDIFGPMRFRLIQVSLYNYHNSEHYIIHRPLFYLKQNVSETEFCLRLQMVPTQLGLSKSTLSYKMLTKSAVLHAVAGSCQAVRGQQESKSFYSLHGMPRE